MLNVIIMVKGADLEEVTLFIFSTVKFPVFLK